jgi:hypothetical protein
MPERDELLTVAEVAAMLKLNQQTFATDWTPGSCPTSVSAGP